MRAVFGEAFTTPSGMRILLMTKCKALRFVNVYAILAAFFLQNNTMRVIYAFGKSDPAGNDLAPRDIHQFKNRGDKILYLLVQ